MRKIAFSFALALIGQCAAHADDTTLPQACWGSPSVDGGKCCKTLMEVRDNIDRIDRTLVKILAERQKYVAEAGRFKKDPAAVSAPARVEAIVAKVRAEAETAGLDPAVAEATFLGMIAAFEDYERTEWKRRKGAEAPTK